MSRRRTLAIALMVMIAMTLPTGAALAAPPDNDDFSGSIVIDPADLPFTDTVDTTEATNAGADLEAGPLCVGPPATEAGVWYSFTPAADMNVFVDTAGTDYSAGILVYTGAPGSFELVQCEPGETVFAGTAGVTYHMMIIDDQGDGGGNGGTLELLVNDAGEEVCAGIFSNAFQLDVNIIIGTDGDDELVGTAGPDGIIGLEGDDFIKGLGGDDLIAGCDGDDTILAGAGDDQIAGDALGFFGNPDAEGGDDTVKGGPGDDGIFGGPGDDNLRGGDGNDTVIGHQGNDLIRGDAGDDGVLGGFGDDDVRGGTGDDFVSGGWGNDFLDGGDGDDFLNGAPPAFEDFDPEAEDAVDRCSGGAGANAIVNCEVSRP